MNSPASSRPRFVCRFARLWHAPDSAAAAPAPHVARCAACREYFATAARFDARLHSAAASEAVEVSAGLERRIIQAVARAQRPAARSPAGFRWLAGAAAAAVALAVAFIARDHAPAPARPIAAGPAAVALDPAATTPDWETVVPTARALAAENPLQTELNSVYSDARTALRFLALNFLPSPRQSGGASVPAATSGKG